MARTSNLGRFSIAILALVLLGFLAYRAVTADAPFPAAAQESLKEYIATEFQEDLMDVGGGRSLGVLASTMLQAQDIEFRDARAKGGSENLVVRVVLAPDQAFPTDAALTRYYQMAFQPDGGWTVTAPTTMWGFYLKLF